MSIERHDRVIVEAFVRHLRRLGMPDAQVDRWLEDEYPGTSQVEAIIGDLAVEHTSIDTFPNQRRTGFWFRQIVEPIETVLSPVMPARIRVYLPVEAITPSHDWSAIRLAIAEWLFLNTPVLADGVHELQIPRTRFTGRISKDSRGTPALLFWLEVSDDGSLSGRVNAQIIRKATKLARHHPEGKIGVLLLESEDGSTMNASTMLDTIRRSCAALPEGIDQLWFVDGTRELAPEFCDLTPHLLGSTGVLRI